MNTDMDIDINTKQHIPSLLYAMRIADFFTNR